MPATKTPAVTADEYADQIAAGWPPLTEQGAAELARVMTPVVRELAASTRPAKRRTPRRAA